MNKNKNGFLIPVTKKKIKHKILQILIMGLVANVSNYPLLQSLMILIICFKTVK